MLTPDTIKAIGQGVIVRRVIPEPTTKTVGGIIVPQTNTREDANIAVGHVLSVGPKVTEVAVGDLAMFRLALAIPLPQGVETADKRQLFKFDELNGVLIGIINQDDFDKLNASAIAR